MIEELVKKSIINPGQIPGTLSQFILGFQNKLKLPQNVKIGLLGSDESVDPVRNELYRLAYPFKENTLVDLGNMSSKNPEHIESLFSELFEAQIIPIFISSDNRDFSAQLKISLKNAVTNSWAIIHPSMISDIDGRDELIEATESGHASFKFIGHQIHVTPAQTIREMDKLGMSSIRLGHVRQHIDSVEPWCRSLDHAMFDLNALRKTDFMAKKDNNPGGLFYEEACKICQFIGASAHLKSFGFYGYDSARDKDGQSAAVAAQLIWYFIEGYHNHREEKAIQKSKMTQYIVHDHQNGGDIHFWKNNASGRWWLEIPGHADHWISCTYEDYHAASIGTYSSRVVSVMNLD